MCSLWLRGHYTGASRAPYDGAHTLAASSGGLHSADAAAVETMAHIFVFAWLNALPAGPDKRAKYALWCVMAANATTPLYPDCLYEVGVSIFPLDRLVVVADGVVTRMNTALTQERKAGWLLAKAALAASGKSWGGQALVDAACSKSKATRLVALTEDREFDAADFAAVERARAKKHAKAAAAAADDDDESDAAAADEAGFDYDSEASDADDDYSDDDGDGGGSGGDEGDTDAVGDEMTCLLTKLMVSGEALAAAERRCDESAEAVAVAERVRNFYVKKAKEELQAAAELGAHARLMLRLFGVNSYDEFARLSPVERLRAFTATTTGGAAAGAVKAAAAASAKRKPVPLIKCGSCAAAEAARDGAWRDAVEARAGSGAGSRVALACRDVRGQGPVVYEVRLSLPPVAQLRAGTPSLAEALAAGPSVAPGCGQARLP